jgi:NADH-quinone oxidoreductase subunit F
MLLVLNAITRGEGKPGDVDLLEAVAESVKLGSLCGLGQTAPNPVLTTLRYFRSEYEDHITHRKCPAVVCGTLVGAPCRHTCPAGIDVPRYVRYVAARRFTDALNVIREKIPLPSVCGYVCFHPCEKKCRRRQMDDPIAVRALKRFLADRGMRGGVPWPPRAAATGKRVAVVGAGPAGLTAAYYLGRLGHEVTVFERAGDAGGTLRSGIPEFRLPRHVIASEIEAMREAAGFTLRTHAAVGSVEDLRRQGYDAVVLAFGAQKGATMGIEGEDAPGVHDCLSFLRRVNAGEPIEVGGRVVVVGGGSSAMDAARTAVRLGARQVTVMYRRTRAEMPAADEEVRDAVAEGVELSFLVVPVRIRREPGGLVVECVRMRLGTVAEDGRRRPTPVEGSTFEAPADTVVMAVGQSPEDALRGEVPTDAQRRVVVDGDTLQTSRPGVFAAGDVVTGPSSVIESIAGGRRAAEAVDRYLGGRGEIREVLAPTGEAERVPPAEEHGERRRREVPRRSAAERIADTEDVELTYPEAEAVAEAERCLACDLEQAAEDAVRQAAEADGSVAEPEVLTGAGLSPEASRVP